MRPVTPRFARRPPFPVSFKVLFLAKPLQSFRNVFGGSALSGGEGVEVMGDQIKTALSESEVEERLNNICRLKRELYGISGGGIPGGVIASGDTNRIIKTFQEIITNYEELSGYRL